MSIWPKNVKETIREQGVDIRDGGSKNSTANGNDVAAVGPVGVAYGGVLLAKNNPTGVLGGREGYANNSTPNSGGGTTSYTVNTGNQPYMNQLNSLYDQIMNRKPFQYDLNGDLLYRQMADQYTQLGQQAMRDATGQAAALTGGYGNTYANQVGNQAYQQYLTALNQNIPELWDRAYQVYQDQGDQLLQQYQLAAAHPEYLNALKPRTYTVTNESDDTSADTSYLQALINSGLMAGGIAPAYANELTGHTYKILEEEKDKK